jgi:hypothetical protein
MRVKPTKIVITAVASIACLCSTGARSEPTSSPLKLEYIRPYGGTNIVFIKAAIAPGSFCASNIYSLDMATNTGKAMYAAALAALLSEKNVQLELINCGGGPSGSNSLQSIYILG